MTAHSRCHRVIASGCIAIWTTSSRAVMATNNKALKGDENEDSSVSGLNWLLRSRGALCLVVKFVKVLAALLGSASIAAGDLNGHTASLNHYAFAGPVECSIPPCRELRGRIRSQSLNGSAALILATLECSSSCNSIIREMAAEDLQRGLTFFCKVLFLVETRPPA